MVATIVWWADPHLINHAHGVPAVHQSSGITPSYGSMIPTTQPPPSPPPSNWPVMVSQPDLPNGLNPTACMQYAPTGLDRHQVVFLDAGHGGVDPGAVGNTSSGAVIEEKAANLAVELNARELLRAAGYGVVVSRTADTTVARLVTSDYDNGLLTAHAVRLDALARAACANAANAVVLVAIHFNAGDSPAFGGVMTLFDDARSFTPQNLRLASLVQTTLTDAYRVNGLEIADLGTVADSMSGTPALTARGAAYGHLIELGPESSGWVDHPSVMPGILVEAMHVSRPSEADVANSPNGQTLIAGALVAGIEKFLG
jgi:N-acetylmuramoyl-L-alanine amidase